MSTVSSLTPAGISEMRDRDDCDRHERRLERDIFELRFQQQRDELALARAQVARLESEKQFNELKCQLNSGLQAISTQIERVSRNIESQFTALNAYNAAFSNASSAAANGLAGELVTLGAHMTPPAVITAPTFTFPSPPLLSIPCGG